MPSKMNKFHVQFNNQTSALKNYAQMKRQTKTTYLQKKNKGISKTPLKVRFSPMSINGTDALPLMFDKLHTVVDIMFC